MELTTLRQFIAIADAGHMTRAALRVGVTQPALSAAVKRLEREVGTDLLHRTGKGVELTEAGRVFLEHAQAAVRRAEEGVEAVRELVGLERGTVRLGGGATAVSYLLPPVVAEIRQAHPGLRFYIREAGSASVAEALLRGELELGIVTLPARMPDAGELMPTARLADELHLIVPKGHRLDGADEFSWADLENEPIVAFEAGSAVRAVLDEAATAAGVELRVVMELRSIESIVQMVAAEVGVGFVSEHASSALRSVSALRCREGSVRRELAVIRRRDRVPSPGTAAFERALLARWGRSGKKV